MKIERKEFASVIIPAWNQSDYSIKCIESLSRCAEVYPTELIFIDNGSRGTERSVVGKKISEIRDKFASVKYLKLNSNLGFIKATNIGIDLAEGNHIVFLNNDTVLPKMAIARLVNAQKSTRAWAVGPICRIKNNPEKSSWQSIDRCRKMWNLKLTTIPAFVEGKYDLDDYNEMLFTSKNIMGMYPRMLAFFCTVFPASTIDAIGYLDEIYGHGFADDDDYCKRIIMRGGKIYLESKVMIIHNHRTTFKARMKEQKINYHEESKRNLAIWKSRWGGH